MTTRAFNYSKWDHIELSDDESDLHPNIDKESWFRMKHRSRLEREEKEVTYSIAPIMGIPKLYEVPYETFLTVLLGHRDI